MLRPKFLKPKSRDCPPISVLCPKFPKTKLRDCPPISVACVGLASGEKHT